MFISTPAGPVKRIYTYIEIGEKSRSLDKRAYTPIAYLVLLPAS
jgi:hypothetical protein